MPHQHGLLTRPEGGREHGLQIVGERVRAARVARGAAPVPALVVRDDPVVGGEVPDLGRPEGGRAGPAVREDDGGRVLGVKLSFRTGSVRYGRQA